MLQLLLKPLLGVAGQAVSGFIETKKAKAENKLVEIKAKTKLREQQIAGEVSWEASAVDQMKGSWKDEVILICLLTPAVAVFIPGLLQASLIYCVLCVIWGESRTNGNGTV